MDPFDELLERVRTLTGLNGRAASAVAISIADQHGDAPVSANQIIEEAESLGYEVHRKGPAVDTAKHALPEIELDPAEVLKAVYRECPRLLPKQEGHDAVALPRVGRAPKESIFYDEEIRAQIDALPEEIRVLVGHVDLFNGQMTVTLYDEANDVDRHIGPIDLARYGSEGALTKAIYVLCGRLPRVLAADWN